MRRITVTLPEELEELVRYEADRRGVSISEVIRESVASALLGAGTRDIPWAGIFNDPDMPSGSRLEQALGSWPHDLDRRRR